MQKIKGLWIPAEILFNKDLSYKEKLIKMLWMDYYFYSSKLPEEERRNQLLLLIGFFIVLFIIGGIGEFIRHKSNKKK